MAGRNRPAITVTVGPSNFDEERWKTFADAGATGFRVPFSKETPDEQFDRCMRLATLFRDYGHRPRIIADLPGRAPRFRNANNVDVKVNCEYRVGGGEDSAPNYIGCTYSALLANLERGDEIIIGDGELRARIISNDGKNLRIEFINEGTLKRQRGIFSKKMERLLHPIGNLERQFVEDERVSYIDLFMLSFCSDAAHVREFVDLMRQRGRRVEVANIIAKIETPLGVKGALGLASTGCEILLGRGDLFVTSGVVDFYNQEQTALDLCIRNTSPERFMVGTALLEQFAQTGVPSRAEISYLGRLISSGVTSFLLSGETTVGIRGIECVRLINALSESILGGANDA